VRTGNVASLALVVLGLTLSASEGGQRLSPHETTVGTIDGARITITYGRPSMRGRKIMGALVEYGEDWTPGADEATTLETSRQIRIEDVTVPAGKYSVWMRPTANRWTMVLNRNPNLFHTDNRSRRNDLAPIVLRKRALDQPVEQLTFAIEQTPSGGGAIVMSWETTEVSASVAVVE